MLAQSLQIGLSEALLVAAVGLLAGALGGLLGIGGSVVMIPGLAFAFHNAGPQSQHLFQASAMAVNVVVAAPAALTHARKGAVRREILVRMLVPATVAIVAGVALANRLDGSMLRKLFAVFLLYVAGMNISRTIRRSPEPTSAQARITWARCSVVGAAMGFSAGLLGIGGGILTIPLIQTICRAPLRQCIGATSAAMCLTALVGATARISTLSQHGYTATQALAVFAALAPTAMGGSWLGARLSHALPLPVVRAVLVAVMLLAAWRMWAIS
ncbi:MAG: sulfite exporter TauE/SafE family protein [Planctomycetota bacterium]|nr:MAG: sulfite exporter TauE/SafE family protein [Planctomycetota bacterium]